VQAHQPTLGIHDRHVQDLVGCHELSHYRLSHRIGCNQWLLMHYIQNRPIKIDALQYSSPHIAVGDGAAQHIIVIGYEHYADSHIIEILDDLTDGSGGRKDGVSPP
jgi:hypothetical protein